MIRQLIPAGIPFGCGTGFITRRNRTFAMPEPLLQVEDLHSSQVPPVTFALAAGEILTVQGPSGVGKSQMLRALADLAPHAGRVQLSGRLQVTVPPEQWRRQVMLVPAESGWWADTVAEHFDRSPPDDWFARLSLRPALFTAPVERLSSGERQRLAVLRALMLEPSVLLLDEPTANLDEANAEALAQLIVEQVRLTGAGAIWVTHDRQERRRFGAHTLVLRPEGGLVE